METIKNYLDNMFTGLPKTEEMMKLKEDIYANMLDKYQEIKAAGKSESEAIGVVISEFGNIEEILDEFGVSCEIRGEEHRDVKEELPEVNLDTAKEYIKVMKMVGKFVGIGVALCIIGVAIMIVLQGFEQAQSMSGNNMSQAMGLTIMFLFVAGGVALFIYSGFLVSPYSYMDRQFNMSNYVKQQITAEWAIERPSNIVRLVIGICLCILSPIPLFLSVYGASGREEMTFWGTGALMLVAAIGVYLIILAGNTIAAYNRLLELGDYTPARKRGNKLIELTASIVWPLASGVYIFIGFVFGLWHPGWIIFPVTGVIFGIFSAIVEGIADNK